LQPPFFSTADEHWWQRCQPWSSQKAASCALVISCVLGGSSPPLPPLAVLAPHRSLERSAAALASSHDPSP